MHPFLNPTVRGDFNRRYIVASSLFGHRHRLASVRFHDILDAERFIRQLRVDKFQWQSWLNDALRDTDALQPITRRVADLVCRERIHFFKLPSFDDAHKVISGGDRAITYLPNIDAIETPAGAQAATINTPTDAETFVDSLGLDNEQLTGIFRRLASQQRMAVPPPEAQRQQLIELLANGHLKAWTNPYTPPAPREKAVEYEDTMNLPGVRSVPEAPKAEKPEKVETSLGSDSLRARSAEVKKGGEPAEAAPSKLDEIFRKIPEPDYHAIKERSVHNVDSETLVLGKYRPTITNGIKDWSIPGPDSYVAIARTEKATYFDLGSEWGSVTSKYNLSDDEMFKAFNIPVLDDAASAGKQIKFTHDPRTNGGFLQQEWDYLQNTHGYKRLKEIDGVWYAK